MDEDFIKMREKTKIHRPDHAIEGLGLGLVSLAQGVGLGIWGFVSKPVEGAQKSGVKGFFTGAFKGITGLVSKPVTGVMDLATKTVEGIKNTAAFLDKSHVSVQRERFIRVFYGRECYIKKYDYNDAEIVQFLWNYKKGDYKKIQVVSTLLLSDQQPKCLVVMSIQKLILFNLDVQKIQWKVDTKNIAKITMEEQNIIITLIQGTKKFKNRVIQLKIIENKFRT